MTHAFDEPFEAPVVDAAMVQNRVKNWQERVEGLMAQISTWASEAGMVATPGDEIVMNEELMVEFGVPPVQLPSLVINREGRFAAKVIPYGLWIIGGNGRVDLKTRHGVHMIIDLARPFDTSDWRIAGPALRNAPRLDRTSLDAALAA